MKGFVILTVCLCALLSVVLMSFADIGRAEQAVAVPVFGDQPAETELVATFYRVLLQEEEPTLEQELALIGKNDNLRQNLIEVQGHNPESAVVMNLFREHRELFVGRRTPQDRILSGVRIFTPYTYGRSLEGKPDALTEYLYVMVLVSDYDHPDKLTRTRTVRFTISDAHIMAYEIETEGYHSTDPDTNVLHRFGRWPEENLH